MVLQRRAAGLLLGRLILPLCILLTSLPGAAQFGPAAQDPVGSLAVRFEAVLFGHLANLPVEISPQSRQNIRAFLHAAAQRMVSDGATEPEIEAAIRSLDRLAYDFYKEGQRLPNGRVRLGESTVDRVIQAICPLYPFC